ncbi:hypothetical protein AQUCO_00900694v1 [Aquilegia coerulea]|uniref:U-box domain-containing protein n=1 Tax=Aquilegia coerulea TaxID=218851 RepID=A0A2G5EEZ6_AQUCA|nr:hypothetical protein AQUCO_00900694v1 [Aquilegia coerulea]
MEDVDIPQYFICPISLQIMKDPVTIVTGITYDRESIEQWLSADQNTSCPVTKQPLPKDFDLTPNHTLRRLIQAWCVTNAANGVDRIPTPKSPLNNIHILKLIQDLRHPQLKSKSLNRLVLLASECEKNRKCMMEAGVAKVMVSLIITSYKNNVSEGVHEAMHVLSLIKIPIAEINLLIYDFFDAIAWILRGGKYNNEQVMKTHALLVLKSVVELASSSLLDRLKPEFIATIIQVLRENISNQANKAALQVLLDTCPWGRNKVKIIEAGGVFDLIELELSSPDKRTTDLIFGILDHLCTCADGRAKFLSHSAGIAMVTKKIFRVSPVTDDRAVRILASICKFTATHDVLQEMLVVGAVAKLCMVLQADGSANIKEKARGVLRLHNNFWSNSPCIQLYLVTRHPTQ